MRYEAGMSCHRAESGKGSFMLRKHGADIRHEHRWLMLETWGLGVSPKWLTAEVQGTAVICLIPVRVPLLGGFDIKLALRSEA